jgi:hypothetical protein
MADGLIRNGTSVLGLLSVLDQGHEQ